MMSSLSFSSSSTTSTNISSIKSIESSNTFTPSSSLAYSTINENTEQQQPVVAESRGHRRGRSNVKRSQSTEENVCVVAFLVQGQTMEQKAVMEKVQEIRRRFDQAYSRWEPHLTLISPFIIPFTTPLLDGPALLPEEGEGEENSQENLVRETLDQLSGVIEKVCSEQDCHVLTLDEVDQFTLRRYNTIHLRPSPFADSETFLRLQKELEIALPQAKQHSRNKGNNSRDSYKPHLTLGQSKNARINAEIFRMAADALNEGIKQGEQSKLQIRVDKIQLMVKPVDRTGPYDVYREFALRDAITLT